MPPINSALPQPALLAPVVAAGSDEDWTIAGGGAGEFAGPDEPARAPHFVQNAVPSVSWLPHFSQKATTILRPAWARNTPKVFE